MRGHYCNHNPRAVGRASHSSLTYCQRAESLFVNWQINVAKISVFFLNCSPYQKKKKKPNSWEIIMNIKGSVLKSYLSVHQQICYYRPGSPARPRPIPVTHWVPWIPSTSQWICGLGLPGTCGRGGCSCTSRGSQMLPGKLPSCLPFWDHLFAFISPLKGSYSGRKTWLHQPVPTSLQSSQPWRKGRGVLPLRPSAQTVHNMHFRDAPICNALLSQDFFFFNEQVWGNPQVNTFKAGREGEMVGQNAKCTIEQARSEERSPNS